jgi:hypothetical protein
MLLARIVQIATRHAMTPVKNTRRGEIDIKPSRNTSRTTNTVSVDLGLMAERKPPEPISSLVLVSSEEVINE